MNAIQVLFAVTMVSLSVSLTYATWLAYRRVDSPMVAGGLRFGTFYAMAVLLAVLTPLIPGVLARAGPNAMALTAMTHLLMALRMQVGHGGPRSTRALWATYAAGVVLLFITGWSEAYDAHRITLISSFLLLLQWYALWLVQQWRRQEASRSLDLISGALALGLTANAVRLVVVAAKPWRFTIYAGDAASVAIVTAFVLAFVLFYLGLWGYFAERVRVQAEADRQRLRERDEILLATSRLAAVGTVSVYSATLVHELTQPLQAVRLALDGAQRKLRSQPALDGVKEDVDEALRLIGRTTDTVVSLRNLIQLGNTSRSTVDVLACVRTILPVIEGEAQRRGIRLEVTQSIDAARVVCDALMLQRIVFNLVGNAFEAIGSEPGERRVRLRTGAAPVGPHPGIALDVEDSGPGLPLHVIEQLPGPFATSKPTGMGLGLALAQEAARQWGGSLDLRPGDPATGRGLVVRLLLPLAAPEHDAPSQPLNADARPA